MTQASCPLSPPGTLDYENTLVLPIELSKTKWVLSAQVPGLLRVKAKQTIEPKAEALLAAIDGYRDRSRAVGRTVERVVAIYEASWSGFKDTSHARPPGAGVCADHRIGAGARRGTRERGS